MSVSKDRKPIIAITMGDPRGIGPEVVAKALAQRTLQQICVPLVLGDLELLSRTVEGLSLGLKVTAVDEGLIKELPNLLLEGPSGVLPVFPLSRLSMEKSPGEIPPEESSRASFAYIEKAAAMALRGEVAAMATAPVSKEAIARCGIPFRGHTEYLAEISGTREFVMMLAGERLKVSLVTTHLPLREVAGLLREEKILSVIEITGKGLQECYQIRSPRIAVTALNPHAGEGGLFGKEEYIISQAIQRARKEGWFVSGPWPADSLFHRAEQGEFDAVVCMYHDQGLIPLKLLHFDSAVNVTLGLPFIRTSADHGVAYDIAGKGLANARSMEEAIRLAALMAERKSR